LVQPRLHITGASGCGVSTLGGALARRLGVAHLDTDAFYWLPTDPPFQTSRVIPERLAMLETAFAAAHSGWVLSGSLDGWGDPLIPRFERVIFLSAATEVRLARLRAREQARHGAVIDEGGASHAHHLDFLAYAEAYDTGRFTGAMTGRHRARHETWLARLPCPVLRLDGEEPTERLADAVLASFADAH